MAIAAAPVELDEPQVVDGPQVVDEISVAPARPAQRWGPPIWPADEPIVAVDRPSAPKIDITFLAVLTSDKTN